MKRNLICLPSLAFVLAIPLGVTGCRSDPNDANNNNNNNNNPGSDAGVNNPGGDAGVNNPGNDAGGNPNNNNNNPTACGDLLNICALKVDGHPAAPAIGGRVELHGVVVTTPTIAISKNPTTMEVTTAGFFVQDSTTSVSLSGRNSGIMVVYNPKNVAGGVRPIGDVIDVEGTLDEFGRDGFRKARQVRALRITAKNLRRPITPTDVDDVTTIATDGADAKAFEGSLLKVKEVTVTTNMVKHEMSDIFGAFRVENSLIVWLNFFSDRRPNAGAVYASITGVLQVGTAPFNAGESLLTPRLPTDIVPKNQSLVVERVQDLQDPQSPGHPAETCANMGTLTGNCAQVKFTKLVVTAVDGYVSKNLRSVFAQDADATDPKFSGIKIVYGKDQLANGYKPKVGHLIDVTGEAVEYYGGTQVSISGRGAAMTQNPAKTGTVAATLIETPSLLSRDNPEANAYEGVLVRIENVSVVNACEPTSGGLDFGQWSVTGGVLLGTGFEYNYVGKPRPSTITCEDQQTGVVNPACKCGAGSRPNDQRHAGDSFTSITGVIDYAFDDYQLYPRSNADLVVRQ